MNEPRYVIVRARLKRGYHLGNLQQILHSKVGKVGRSGIRVRRAGGSGLIEIWGPKAEIERALDTEIVWEKSVSDKRGTGTHYTWKWRVVRGPLIGPDIGQHVDDVIIDSGEKQGP